MLFKCVQVMINDEIAMIVVQLQNNCELKYSEELILAGNLTPPIQVTQFIGKNKLIASVALTEVWI